MLGFFFALFCSIVLADLPAHLRFECYDTATAAEGFRTGADAKFSVFAESRDPRDAGRATACTVTGDVLDCQIQWLNATATSDFKLTYDSTKTPPTATASLTTTDGKAHAEDCFVEGV